MPIVPADLFGHRPARPGWETTTLAPSVSDPLRVLAIGDSLGEDLGAQLQTQLGNSSEATFTADAKGDTGLANAGYYNWPSELLVELATVHPQVVVILLGANDGQGIDVNGTAAAFGTPTWQLVYTQRVDQILQESNAAHADVVWVGEPAMQDPALDAHIQLLDGIYAREVAKYPEALYLASNSVLAPGGQFTSTATDPSGEIVTTRTPDGVHLTASGAQLLAAAVVSSIDQRWRLQLPP